MMKKSKIWIVNVLVLVIIMSIIIPSFNCLANDNSGNSSIELIGVENVNNDDTISQIAILLNEESQKNQTVKIGDYFSIYNAEDEDLFFVYPIYVNSICKYIAEVSEDGTPTVTNNIDIIKKIKLLDSGQYVVYIDNGLLYAESYLGKEFISQVYLSEQNEIKDFVTDTFYEKKQFLDLNYSFENLRYVDINSEEYIYTIENKQNNNSRSVVGGIEDSLITYKCNITNFVSQGNYGLCWSAASATIINYKTGSNFNAQYLADKYHIDYDAGANAVQIQSCLNGSGLSYNASASKISWSQIKSNINADKPFVIGLVQSGAGIGHALTGYGYGCLSRDTGVGFRTIYAWDPNGYKISFLDNLSSAITTSGRVWSWSESIY